MITKQAAVKKKNEKKLGEKWEEITGRRVGPGLLQCVLSFCDLAPGEFSSAERMCSAQGELYFGCHFPKVFF